MSVINNPSINAENVVSSFMLSPGDVLPDLKSILTYLVLTAIFVVIFGGITLLAYFISKLNF